MAASKSVKKSARNEWTVSVMRDRSMPVAAVADKKQITLPLDTFRIAGTQADSKGNVIFADSEEVSQSKFEAGFENCLALAKSMIENAADIGNDFEVEEITLKLSANAKYGCSLIADATIEGGIEVTIKRKTGH
jgi:hypothetical protein